MDIFRNQHLLDRYLADHTSPEDPVLEELSRYTYLKEAYPRMISGHLMGKFLEMFSQLVSPNRVLEIGTFTGYSAICLAKGLSPSGKLITIEVNDELRNSALEFFTLAGVKDQIEIINGDALKVIPTLDKSFDLVFIDARKEDYTEYYRLVIEKVSPGGYILADNVLWGGKVLNKKAPDQATLSLKEFSRMVNQDPKVENMILPIRDGVMVIKKH